MGSFGVFGKSRARTWLVLNLQASTFSFLELHLLYFPLARIRYCSFSELLHMHVHTWPHYDARFGWRCLLPIDSPNLPLFSYWATLKPPSGLLCAYMFL